MKRAMVLLLILTARGLSAQESDENFKRWVSLGVRSTLSAFDEDGFGMGSGGQFRIKPGRRVNTEWFADYISIAAPHQVRSNYAHIGWSVMYYLTKYCDCTHKIQPYVLAGHCFDYNQKTVMDGSMERMKRWGSAVQIGAGMHFSFSERMDMSLTAQYMVHLTTGIEAYDNGGQIKLRREEGKSTEGHLLTTISLNYKIFDL